MAVYRLEYAETRKFENGKWTPIPVDKMVYTPLNFTTTDYNEADQMRCELCSSMSQGYVRIVEDYM
jgi:hypothetical protein